MTTNQIMKADEIGSFPERACGQAGALIRERQRQGLSALAELSFMEGNAQDSPELRMLRRLRGRVI